MGALDSALLAAVRANGASKGKPYLVGHFATSASLNPQDCFGGVVTNEGATGAVTLKLPPAQVGMSIEAIALAAQTLSLDPQDTELIVGGGRQAGDAFSTKGDAADYVRLVCVEPGEWQVAAFVAGVDETGGQ